MKKLLLLSALVLIGVQSANAAGVSSYFDQGAIYTGSSFPVDVSKCPDDEKPNFENLKSGESAVHNILGIIETGDGSINAAARNGGIKRIYYVDQKINKVYIPLGFIPVYAKETKTIVYGE